MMKLTRINSKYTDNANKILRDSIGEDFESVILLGFKDGEIVTMASECHKRLEVMGALFSALMTTWEADDKDISS